MIWWLSIHNVYRDNCYAKDTFFHFAYGKKYHFQRGKCIVYVDFRFFFLLSKATSSDSDAPHFARDEPKIFESRKKTIKETLFFILLPDDLLAEGENIWFNSEQYFYLHIQFFCINKYQKPNDTTVENRNYQLNQYLC